MTSIRTTTRNGLVIAAQSVNKNNDVMFITNLGTIVRLHVSDISLIGRNTQGVCLINLNKNQKLIDMKSINTINEITF